MAASKSTALSDFSNLVGEQAIRMEHVELFCKTTTSAGSSSIVEIARFDWGKLTLRRTYSTSGQISVYSLIVQDKDHFVVKTASVPQVIVAQAIYADMSPLAAALLKDREIFDWILESFYKETIGAAMQVSLLSINAPRAKKSGRGPLRA